MKNKIIIGLLILSLVLISGCNTKKEVQLCNVDLTLSEFQEICDNCQEYCGVGCAETEWCIKRIYYSSGFGLRCGEEI